MQQLVIENKQRLILYQIMIVVILLILDFMEITECKDYWDHVSCDKSIGNFQLFGHTNDTIYSKNNYTKLTIQFDGNLVLKSRINTSSDNDWIIKWQTGSYYNGISNNEYPEFVVQTDGNLVIYPLDNGQGWTSGTYYWGSYSDWHLVVNDAGYAYLLGPNSNQVVQWTTNKTITVYPTYKKSELFYPNNFPSTEPTNSPTHNGSILSPTTSIPTSSTLLPTNSFTVNPSYFPSSYVILYGIEIFLYHSKIIFIITYSSRWSEYKILEIN